MHAASARAAVCAVLLWSASGQAGPASKVPPASSGAAESRSLTVQVQVEPAERLVEPGQPIPVTIRVKDAEGAGVDDLQLRLAASGGRFDAVEPQGGGLYRATYRMPAGRHPQAVILAAKAPGAPPGWTVLRLRSKVDLPTRTTKPRVQVTLALGGRTYGPMRSDARGHVSIPVVVGPGDTEAVANALDEFGNRKQRTVRIPLPPVPRLVGFAERTRLAADGHDATDIYLVAIEPDGRPNGSLRVVATRKGGSLSPARRLGPGLYVLRYTAPGRLARKRTSLVLADKSAPRISRVKFRFALTAGQPARLTLEAAPESLPADGEARARLTMTVADQAGNPLGGTPPTLGCARGTTRPVRELGGGRYQALYQAPAGQPGPVDCRASLQPKDGAALMAETRLTLEPPAVGSLEVVADRKRLPMDGRAQARLAITVRDPKGRPLDGVRISARAGVGAVDPVSPDGDGRYHASYTAPLGTEGTRVRIDLVAGRGEQKKSAELILDLEGVEPPRPPAPWLTLGPSAALLTNFGRLLSGGFSVEAAVKVPGLAGYLYLGLESGYRHGRSTDETALADRSLRTELGLAPLHLLLLFKPFPRAVFTPVLGLGGGLDFVQWTIRGPLGSEERDHAMLWGAQATVGAELQAGPGALVVQVRYLYAYLSQRAGVDQPAAEGGSRLKGNVGGMDVTLGYQLHF